MSLRRALVPSRTPTTTSRPGQRRATGPAAARPAAGRGGRAAGGRRGQLGVEVASRAPRSGVDASDRTGPPRRRAPAPLHQQGHPGPRQAGRVHAVQRILQRRWRPRSPAATAPGPGPPRPGRGGRGRRARRRAPPGDRRRRSPPRRTPPPARRRPGRRAARRRGAGRRPRCAGPAGLPPGPARGHPGPGGGAPRAGGPPGAGPADQQLLGIGQATLPDAQLGQHESGCQPGTPMAAANSACATSTASASAHRPSSMRSVACTLSQWLLRNSGPPGSVRSAPAPGAGRPRSPPARSRWRSSRR